MVGTMDEMLVEVMEGKKGSAKDLLMEARWAEGLVVASVNVLVEMPAQRSAQATAQASAMTKGPTSAPRSAQSTAQASASTKGPTSVLRSA
jgi:hypothetical protein